LNHKDSQKENQKDGSSTRNKTVKKNPVLTRTFGPVHDLERHLPSDWWKTLFNSLYLKTDGDVVENPENTKQEIDQVIQTLALEQNDNILDLCCGQGRHTLELARRGFTHVTGIDRSRYLIRLARKRARTEKLSLAFHEGDARRYRPREAPFHSVLLLGNSFGYFEQKMDDEAVLKNIAKLLVPNGFLFLDIVDGEWMQSHYEQRSWEWIDENHFVCRERALSKDSERIVTRELISHGEKGVIADQFYAERLYTKEKITDLLEKCGYQNVYFHGPIETASTRGQDLGMMAHRMILTVQAPKRTIMVPAVKGPFFPEVTVLFGDPTLPDPVKVNNQFNTEDFETIRRLKLSLEELTDYKFIFMDNHQNLINSLKANPPSFVFNLCDEGFRNDPFKELHIPAILEMLNIPYTGAGPACLGLCYNKNFIRAIAESLDIPVPMESYLEAGDMIATLPATFPAIVKPNFGDSSMGITKDALVTDSLELLNYTEWIRKIHGSCPILVQEFLTGPEYSIGIIGNPGLHFKILCPLEVDYSGLDPDLPQILGYESKWQPDSPYWNQIKYKRACLDDEIQRQLADYASVLFERLGCRDYARFDFRTDISGTIKLLEVNPNPGWCWDGKMNIMAGFDGLRYSDMLRMILEATQERISVQESVSLSPVIISPVLVAT
jgi:D-alanine-D-alanine ligase